MPLFSSKFSPKKTQPRKFERTGNKNPNSKDQEDLSLEIGPIKVRLGDQEAIFENGQWIPGNYAHLTDGPIFGETLNKNGPASGKHRENEHLRLCIQRLEDENNMLKLKSEILMDMLTQTTAESHLHVKVLEMVKTANPAMKRVQNR